MDATEYAPLRTPPAWKPEPGSTIAGLGNSPRSICRDRLEAVVSLATAARRWSPGAGRADRRG